jgi:hypothetical protein
LKKKRRVKNKKMSRNPRSGRRKPCVGLEDDDGLSKLECFLQGYRRVTRKQACQIQVVGEPVVWAYKDYLWDPVNPAEVKRTIEKASPEKSICAALFSNLFKLDDTQSETLKSAFDDVQFPDVVGLYEKQGQFVIVVRIPYSMPLWTRRGLRDLSAFGAYAAVHLGNSAIRHLLRSPRAKMILQCFKERYDFSSLFKRQSNDPVKRQSNDPVKRQSNDPVKRQSNDPVKRQSNDLVVFDEKFRREEVFGEKFRREEDIQRELCVKKIMAWDAYRKEHGDEFLKDSHRRDRAMTLFRPYSTKTKPQIFDVD